MRAGLANFETLPKIVGDGGGAPDRAAISGYNISHLMGRPEPLSDDEILSYLNRSAKPASVRQIASALGLRHAARRALAKSITRLKRRKLIEEVRAGCYRVAGAKIAAGLGATAETGGGVAMSTETSGAEVGRGAVLPRGVPIQARSRGADRAAGRAP